MKNQVQEFFREGLRRPAPGWFIGLCRLAFGLMWLYSARWKTPPSFGQGTEMDLWYWLQEGIQHPAWSWYGNFLTRVVAPNFSLFGRLLFLLEFLTGLSLLLGLLTRVSSTVGILLSLNMLLGLAAHPAQMPVTYVLMIMFQMLFIVTNAGQNWGLDQILLEKLANSAYRRTTWGQWLIKIL